MHKRRRFALAALACLAGTAQAQVPLPTQVPSPVPSTLPGELARRVDGTLDQALQPVRSLQAQELLRRHRRTIDADPAGAPVLRRQIVAIDPEPQALRRLYGAGFQRLRDTELEPLRIRATVLQAPPRLSTRAAVAEARRLDPDGHYEYNHVFWRASAQAFAFPATALPAASTATAAAAAGFRVGLVDGGVDAAHPALAGTELHAWGCGGKPMADAHGTAVASLLAGRAVAEARGAAVLYAADVYCGEPTGGAATDVAQALAWLAREDVGVINLSLVGPPNRLLKRAVRGLGERGHLVVAAVGNDGPAAPPLYPAAYPEVIGVSAVNARNRILPEAGRGPQVDFAAPGADMVAAAANGKWQRVRGTSYAAPLVARLAAQAMAQPGPSQAAAARAQLERIAIAPPGADPAAYGRGVVGTELRAERAPVP